jgi:hypothetical protein
LRGDPLEQLLEFGTRVERGDDDRDFSHVEERRCKTL